MFKPNKSKKVSVVVPTYNESNTIESILSKIFNADFLECRIEIIVVDDHSTDQTYDKLNKIFERNKAIRIFRHSSNKGKGAALRTAFSKATGQIIIIQDADLEYDPKEYPKLLKPILEEKADVVFGSRFRSENETRVLYFWHRIANGFLTLLSNMFTNLNLTDMETGYKVFRKEILDGICLTENRFGIEPEITAKISRIPRIRIYEVGISYFGRTYEEGKKIGIKDGFRALYAIIKYNLIK